MLPLTTLAAHPPHNRRRHSLRLRLRPLRRPLPRHGLLPRRPHRNAPRRNVPRAESATWIRASHPAARIARELWRFVQGQSPGHQDEPCDGAERAVRQRDLYFVSYLRSRAGDRELTILRRRINELSFDESKALLSYLFTLQHQSHSTSSLLPALHSLTPRRLPSPFPLVSQ